MVYQPIVDHVEGIVCAHEALSRPQYDGQFIPPDVWFRAAFERNRSIEADWLALTISISGLRGLSSEMTSIPLFVNVMPSSLVQDPFIEQLELLFRDGFCEPHQLVIEIVEYISYDVARLSRMVKSIRSLGIRIALDDVGAGSTSLEALFELEPDWIKVDRALIQGISILPSKQRFLSRLVRFMGSGNAVIAEGVENYEDLKAVREAGVNISQGYYWSRPMSIYDLRDLLSEIERKRNELVKLAQIRNGLLTDEAVIHKNQQLDMLITLYQRLLCIDL